LYPRAEVEVVQKERVVARPRGNAWAHGSVDYTALSRPAVPRGCLRSGPAIGDGTEAEFEMRCFELGPVNRRALAKGKE
jgi:hypothetical protein